VLKGAAGAVWTAWRLWQLELPPLWLLELAMSEEDLAFHREREQSCRELAEHATDPEVRKCHEELARLHAELAARPAPQH
jgi:hypothetical protein